MVRFRAILRILGELKRVGGGQFSCKISEDAWNVRIL
jgi:hypothetical protein